MFHKLEKLEIKDVVKRLTHGNGQTFSSNGPLPIEAYVVKKAEWSLLLLFNFQPP
jgi:hypothetical protein